jgi:hypothetical protein
MIQPENKSFEHTVHYFYAQLKPELPQDGVEYPADDPADDPAELNADIFFSALFLPHFGQIISSSLVNDENTNSSKL